MPGLCHHLQRGESDSKLADNRENIQLQLARYRLLENRDDRCAGALFIYEIMAQLVEVLDRPTNGGRNKDNTLMFPVGRSVYPLGGVGDLGPCPASGAIFYRL